MNDTWTDHEAEAEARWSKFGESLEDEAISLFEELSTTTPGKTAARMWRRYDVFDNACELQSSDAPYGARSQAMIEFIRAGIDDGDLTVRAAYRSIADMFSPIRDITSPVNQSV